MELVMDINNLSKFEALEDVDLEVAVGGKSTAYQAGYYTGKVVKIGFMLAPFLL